MNTNQLIAKGSESEYDKDDPGLEIMLRIFHHFKRKDCCVACTYLTSCYI